MSRCRHPKASFAAIKAVCDPADGFLPARPRISSGLSLAFPEFGQMEVSRPDVFRRVMRQVPLFLALTFAAGLVASPRVALAGSDFWNAIAAGGSWQDGTHWGSGIHGGIVPGAGTCARDPLLERRRRLAACFRAT